MSGNVSRRFPEALLIIIDTGKAKGAANTFEIQLNKRRKVSQLIRQTFDLVVSAGRVKEGRAREMNRESYLRCSSVSLAKAPISEGRDVRALYCASRLRRFSSVPIAISLERWLCCRSRFVRAERFVNSDGNETRRLLRRERVSTSTSYMCEN